MKTKPWILPLLLSLVATPGVLADDGGQKGGIEFGLFAGEAFLDDYGDGAAALDPDDGGLYGGRLGFFFSPKWSVEASWQRISTDTATSSDLDVESWRVNGLRNFRPERALRPYFTLGLGRENTDADGLWDQRDSSFNVGGGLRWFLTRKFGVRWDLRGVSTDLGAPVDDRQSHLETSVGIMWALGGGEPGDDDGDGVGNSRDRCPDTPRGAQVDARGCPTDADGDGVFDGIDKCAGTPTGVPVDGSGCPRDSDGDGVHDGIDKCPATPRNAQVDARGCPKDSDGDGVFDGIDRCAGTPAGTVVDAKGCPKDSDGDGVPDGVDKCPRTPAGTAVDPTGCPRDGDSDGDGVLDSADRCPGTPRGTVVDSRGCKKLFDETRKNVVLEGVNFEFASARLTPQAMAILDRVALSLNEWSELRVEVAGHTDSRGNDDYNLRLSGKRAAAVVSYLTGKGVNASRLVSRGYGEARPIADNASDDGRRRNRRVELSKLN